ncbi:unnamed protein product [Trichobilharzia szidati]|nr:unnamed protein product [Trichobilharzia szidati]
MLIKVGRSKSHNRRKKNSSESDEESTGIPQNYLKVLHPVVNEKRVQFNLGIPSTLTPRGYAKLEAKLTSPNIQKPIQENGSTSVQVFKELFNHKKSDHMCKNSSGHSPENKILYPNPTRMRSFKSIEYEIVVRTVRETKQLYEDPDFPASDISIGNIPDLKGKVEWKRPKDINRDAQFFTGSPSRFDVDQGYLGDCWFNAVVASITKYPQLLFKVIPQNQTLKGSDYSGAVHFQFWRFGQWIDVVIDDRLPVLKGTCRLVFMHSTDGKEFWSSLLEKAYAKLCGTYEHLTGGFQSEAMEDFTGGICQTFILRGEGRPADLLKMLQTYSKTCCLIGCDVDGERIKKREQLGLIESHAYSLTGFACVNYKGKDQYIVRCRNPWGEKHEWKGPWSDKSEEWKHVKSRDKKALGYKDKEDGEFWMSLQDFEDNFGLLEVCHLGLSSLEYNEEIEGKQRMNEIMFTGQWCANVNAGGSMNNMESYSTNPQFSFTIRRGSRKDETKALVIVGLMQKHRRRDYGGDYLSIGFSIYEVSANQRTRLTLDQLADRKPLATSDYIPRREVTLEEHLFSGSFIVIPTTYHPNEECEFIFRIFSSSEMTQQELDDTNIYEGIPKEIINALEATLLSELYSMEERFAQLCNAETKTINATHLSTILNHSCLKESMHDFDGFTESLCRTLLPSVSTNLTGSIDLQEFLFLWAQMKTWKHIFHKNQKHGHVPGYKLREMLIDAGYHVSNRVYHSLACRYIDSKKCTISFEEFLHCMARLRNGFDVTSIHPRNQKNQLVFTVEDYLRFSLST